MGIVLMSSNEMPQEEDSRKSRQWFLSKYVYVCIICICIERERDRDTYTHSMCTYIICVCNMILDYIISYNVMSHNIIVHY